jgi:hypothetical protein
MDLGSSPQEPENKSVAGVLALDGLAPITIFVGANNSGKSRLMRELFGNSEAAKCLRMGPDSEELKLNLEGLLESIRLVDYFSPDNKRSLGEIIGALEALGAGFSHWPVNPNNGWIGVNGISLLDTLNARIDPYIRGGYERKAPSFGDGVRFGVSHKEKLEKDRVAAGIRSALENWSRRYEDIRKSKYIRRMHDYLSLRRCYVPMLRGMRPPLVPVDSNRQSIDASDCYEERSIIDYFIGFPSWRTLNKGDEDKVVRTQQKQAPAFSEKPRIFTGLSLYHDIQKRLLAPTYEERKSIREYETFLSINFFQGREVTLTPALRNQEGKDNDVVHIKIGESEDRPIYALGDGMQSLIICTYPIITELQRGSLFFLEEPDLCMHPSLQRIFLKVLRDSYINKGHQFFLTTHSNHLLDLLEDDNLVSIFSFSEIADQAGSPADPSQAGNGANSKSSKPEQPRFRIRPSNLKDRQTLLELGVRPSATYLANATIWVEGVSDCAYLRAYMEAFVHYLKLRGKDWGKRLVQRVEQYKEDRHYAFVEYNGSNLEHFSFENKEFDDGQAEAESVRKISVPDLCATAIVIADGDVREKGNRSTWLEEQLKERFICLPGKEIENLIPEALMKEQILYDHSPPKQKRVDNSLIELISYAFYATPKAGIGKYLGDTVNIPTYKGTVGNGGTSGTLPSNYKRRWRCEVEGIPALLRKAINPESIRPTPEQTDGANSVVYYGESIQIPDLPSYLTQDLIWLCVCLYVHIAKCNHDQEAEQKLKEFQQFIRDQGSDSKGPTGDPNDGKQPCVESGDPAESAVSEWPIKDVQRNCLLTTFLDSTSQPEATPNPHPEPQAQATSIPPGLTAYPASLNP